MTWAFGPLEEYRDIIFSIALEIFHDLLFVLVYNKVIAVSPSSGRSMLETVFVLTLN